MGRGRSSSGGGSRGSSSSSSRGFSSSSRGRSSSSSRSSSYHYHNSTRVYYSGGSTTSSNISGKGVLIAMGVIFLLIGLSLLIVGIRSFGIENDYKKVQAVAIDNDYINTWYYTTYEYEINGVEYTNRSQEGWEYPETIGKIVTIYYLKDNPNYITEKTPNSDGTSTAVTIGGLVFGLVGVGLIVGGVKTKQQKDTETKQINTISQEEPQVKETKIRCPYCHSYHDKNVDSCPNCGASKSWSD